VFLTFKDWTASQMKMINMVLAMTVIASGSCRRTSGGSKSDATEDGTSDVCPASCYAMRWWISGSSSCMTFCMAMPSLAECSDPNCKTVTAQRYDAGVLATLGPMLYSSQNRSFYLVGGLVHNSYTVAGKCMMQVDNNMPQIFSCAADTLSFPVGQFIAATSQQSGALDAAAAANTPGRYSY
jgi:hypothetical protein